MAKQEHRTKDDKAPPLSVLKEGRDYYWENRFMVFTEAYLLRRGKCCSSGCRHCPYRKTKDNPMSSETN
ncbi:MAG: DUF5522 domain-containing protein [Saprospiraceae bacterium]|nr:DUF5522 domain-containing protein [Saprospiraceae bacterium]MDW8482957.1 DUF5522 domain-containing protein [Saprospiraceae bacterium]